LVKSLISIVSPSCRAISAFLNEKADAVLVLKTNLFAIEFDDAVDDDFLLL